MEEKGEDEEGEGLVGMGTVVEDGDVRGKESELKDRVFTLDEVA